MLNIALTVLGWVAPIVLAPVVYAMARELLNISRKVDDLPVFAKRLVVTFVGTAIVGTLNVLGVTIPVECAGLPETLTETCAQALTGSTVVKGVAAGLAAMVIHAIKKSNPRD